MHQISVFLASNLITSNQKGLWSFKYLLTCLLQYSFYLCPFKFCIFNELISHAGKCGKGTFYMFSLFKVAYVNFTFHI